MAVNCTAAAVLMEGARPRRRDAILGPVLINGDHYKCECIERLNEGDDPIRDVHEAARAKGVQLHILKASTESEIDAAFAFIVQQQAGALVLSADPFFATRREQLVALAARHAVPAIYEFRTFATTGSLMSYGANILAVYRQIGIYTGKILKGRRVKKLKWPRSKGRHSGAGGGSVEFLG
jgi:hypothetical protein